MFFDYIFSFIFSIFFINYIIFFSSPHIMPRPEYFIGLKNLNAKTANYAKEAYVAHLVVSDLQNADDQSPLPHLVEETVKYLMATEDAVISLVCEKEILLVFEKYVDKNILVAKATDYYNTRSDEHIKIIAHHFIVPHPKIRSFFEWFDRNAFKNSQDAHLKKQLQNDHDVQINGHDVIDTVYPHVHGYGTTFLKLPNSKIECLKAPVYDNWGQISDYYNQYWHVGQITFFEKIIVFFLILLAFLIHFISQIVCKLKNFIFSIFFGIDIFFDLFCTFFRSLVNFFV